MHAALPVLALDHVRHAYGATVALDDVSLDLRPGEIVALLGPSGCGKSTLLRVVAGLERQSAGRVVLAGRTLADARTFVAPEARGIGLVFQDYALFPHLDIAANVAFGLARRSGAVARAATMEMLARVRLDSRAQDYPHMLSGGEQQRVALARALAPQPAVLLLDEPFSNLDQGLRREMRNQMVALLKEAGAAALLVTHDPDDAMAVADRIALMRAGALVQMATPQEIYHRPVAPFVLRFFSEVETLPASVRAGAAATPLGSFPAPGLRDGAAQLCVRRTAFSVARDGAGVAARVRDLRFLGERQSVRLEIAGLDRWIEIVLPATEPLRVDASIALAVEACGAFVFAAPAEAPQGRKS